MPTAYILLNTEIDRKPSFKALKQLDGVEKPPSMGV